MTNFKSAFAALVLTVLVSAPALADDKKEEAKKAEEAPKTEEKAALTEAVGGGAGAAGGSLTCQNGNDSRTLSIVDQEGGGWKLVYNKGGADSTVADAKNDKAFLEGKMANVKGNLEKSGFTCN